jgi:hypothetical protein
MVCHFMTMYNLRCLQGVVEATENLSSFLCKCLGSIVESAEHQSVCTPQYHLPKSYSC